VPLPLSAIRACLEGAVPAVIATCARDGTPNVSYLSEVHYVDPQHVALSFQFFSKTRQNVLENPIATLVVAHPETGEQFRLAVHYLRTEESGALFECMKAKLAGIASHTGMAGVFRLRGADVYRVQSIEPVPGTQSALLPSQPVGLAEVRAAMARLSSASELAALLDALLDELESRFGVPHTMVLMRDPARGTLYSVASRGYPQSGIGAEVRPGEGVIGAAAAACTAIRISHATSEFGYGRAMRADTAPAFPGRKARSPSRSWRASACSACCSRKARRPRGSATTRRMHSARSRATSARSRRCSRKAPRRTSMPQAHRTPRRHRAAPCFGCATTPRTTASSSATST